MICIGDDHSIFNQAIFFKTFQKLSKHIIQSSCLGINYIQFPIPVFDIIFRVFWQCPLHNGIVFWVRNVCTISVDKRKERRRPCHQAPAGIICNHWNIRFFIVFIRNNGRSRDISFVPQCWMNTASAVEITRILMKRHTVITLRVQDICYTIRKRILTHRIRGNTICTLVDATIECEFGAHCPSTTI